MVRKNEPVRLEKRVLKIFQEGIKPDDNTTWNEAEMETNFQLPTEERTFTEY